MDGTIPLIQLLKLLDFPFKGRPEFKDNLTGELADCGSQDLDRFLREGVLSLHLLYVQGHSLQFFFQNLVLHFQLNDLLVLGLLEVDRGEFSEGGGFRIVQLVFHCNSN